MRRQGNFGDSSGNAYGGGQIQNPSSQRMDHHNSHCDFQGQLEAFTPEREQPFSDSQADGQWRWDRDGPNMSRPIASSMHNEGQAIDSSRSYYRDPMDLKVVMEKQGKDVGPQPHQKNPKTSYEESRQLETFEGIEQKFMDDITKLAKEQIEAEDAEIARHREKINTINTRYQGQLAALRAQHAGKRDEILRNESQTRQQQYNKQARAMMVPPLHPPHAYIGGTLQDPVPMADAPPSRPYGSDRFDSRFQGGARDHHGFKHRGQYPGGSVYDPGSPFY